jgi:glycosyltransferase 2 family protein
MNDKISVIALLNRESLCSRFFATPADAKRDRRPTDVIMLVISSVVILVFGARVGSEPSTLETGLNEFVAALPDFLEPIWNILYQGLLLWGVFLLGMALFRRHWGLLRDAIVTIVVVVAAALLIGRAATGSWPDIVDGLFDTDTPLDFPPTGLAVWLSIASLASSHISRPYRYLSRWISMLAVLAALALDLTDVGGAIGAVALGFSAAALVHLLFGSPGGLPSMHDLELALLGIGVEADVSEVSRSSGVVRVRARSHSGQDLDVKVYGRDAWDGQLIVALWRFAWYRDNGPTLTLTRLQQVEHEAFVTLLAERRGAPVHPAIAAGEDPLGDALLVIERYGRSLVELEDGLSDEQCARAWSALAALHRAGIAHGGIEPGRVFVDGDAVLLADLANSEVTPTPETFLIDRSQMLATLSTKVGIERAVASAQTALGDDGLADVSSFVQPAALSLTLRRGLSAADIDVDDIRAATVAAIGGEKRELWRLRRLSLGQVFVAVLIFVAFSSLISSLTDIGFDTIWEALQGASLPLVIVAFVFGFSPRVTNAFSLGATSPTKIPLGRLTMLQIAMTFTNLAVPSTAGRVAVNVRFFQRSGVDPTTAVAMGALDGFAGFLAQMVLLGVIFLFAAGSMNLQIDDEFEWGAVGKIIILLAIAAVIAIIAVAVVPKLRNRVIEIYRHLQDFIVPLLKSPKRLLTMLVANLSSEILFAATMYIVMLSYGQTPAFMDLVMVNVFVSMFAGLMPVPGGIGVSEAALTAGFIAIGIPEELAFAIALTYRVVTFYAPPAVGFFAFRWLQRQRYL